MEKIRTINYQELVDCIKTKEMASALSCTTFEISVIVSQVRLLIGDFAEDFDNATMRKRLIEKLKYNPDVVRAKLFALQDFLYQADCMLDECQHYVYEIKEEEDKKEDVRC